MYFISRITIIFDLDMQQRRHGWKVFFIFEEIINTV